MNVQLHYLGDFWQAYQDALKTLVFEQESLITAFDAQLTQCLTTCLTTTGIERKYRIERINSIGSTVRGTYACLPVDFDVSVQTAIPWQDIDQNKLVAVIHKFLQEIQSLPLFAEFMTNTVTHNSTCPSLQVHDIGLRGHASLVVRITATWQHQAAVQQCSFLDITFSNVARTIDYALWMQNYLHRLDTAKRHRLQSEIRLTKLCFQLLGDIYGSKEIGFRPITIEQMVIQSIAFTPPHATTGTFDSLMLHIVKHGIQLNDHANHAPYPFADFKQRYPIWRPGVNANDVNTGEISAGMNLYDLLGNNDKSLAQTKWERLVILADTYCKLRKRCLAWTIDELIGMGCNTKKLRRY